MEEKGSSSTAEDFESTCIFLFAGNGSRSEAGVQRLADESIDGRADWPASRPDPGTDPSLVFTLSTRRWHLSPSH